MNPGATIQAGASMTLGLRVGLELADRDDPVAPDRDVGCRPGLPGAVDDRPAPEAPGRPRSEALGPQDVRRCL